MSEKNNLNDLEEQLNRKKADAQMVKGERKKQEANLNDLKTLDDFKRNYRSSKVLLPSKAEVFITTSKSVENIKEADPKNIQEVYGSQIDLINSYYSIALKHSERSFTWALRAAIAGLLFFITAIASLLLRQPEQIALVSVIGGALIEFIAAVNFYLYGQTTKQLSEFRSGLERTSRYVLANSVAANLTGEHKAEALKGLVLTISTFQPNESSTT